VNGHPWPATGESDLLLRPGAAYIPIR
jgi:hypothetical protein